MRFEPALAPQPTEPGPAYWFLFFHDKILVTAEGDVPRLPYFGEPGPPGLRPLSAQHLGSLDGRPCYAGDLGAGYQPPDGLTLLGLRQLFGRVDDKLFRLVGRASEIANWERTNRYCGCCGTPTADLAGERAKVCPACGQQSFPRLSPAVIAAITRDDEILLARARRFPSDLFSVIAGFVEPGETLEECLRREVREEVGLAIDNIRYFASQPWPFPDSLMIAFTAEYAGGEIAIDGDEIAEAGWFKAWNLPRIPEKISVARRLIDWFAGER